MGHAMTLKGRWVGRGPANWCEGIKIGSSINNSNNHGKIDKDFHADVIITISSTLSDQILFITFDIWLIGGKTYIFLGQGKEKTSTFHVGDSKYLLTYIVWKFKGVFRGKHIDLQRKWQSFYTQAKAWWFKLKSLL